MSAALTSPSVLIAVGLAAAAATLIGGLLALRFSRRIHLILGFSAGAVIGVALLDLLPEALAPRAGGPGPLGVMTAVAAGFLIYLVVDRGLLILARGDAQHRGHFGAGSLTAHSFLDGMAIGLGFQAGPAVGVALAVAVLAHDLADGVNTVNLSLTGSKTPRIARRWLIADAIAPLAGIGASRLVVLPPGGLSVAVALFGGFFLYIGASELLPESHHRHPRVWTTVATVLGVALIWLVVRLAGGQGG
jgi:ZIP family zinc transporter